MPTPLPAYVAIIGSGELADSMAEVHRQLMARLPVPPQPVFIDSLAGFELNIDQIDQKAKAYFRRNFDLELGLARFRSPSDSPEAITEAILAVRRANYLLAGPGSPSYGIRLWRDSQVWQGLLARWAEGAGLVFASAAAIVLGRFAIPVYEIYKAGHEVRWTEGLDLLGQLGVQAAVVPHWNNQSGEQHDTRFCFMGAPRFARLEAQLPRGTLVLGVDEYTALLLDSRTGAGLVLGNGKVTLRRDGCQMTYRRGEQFFLQDDCSGQAAAVPIAEAGIAPAPDGGEPKDPGADILALRQATQTALAGSDFEGVVTGLVGLGLVAGAGLEQNVLNRTELAVQSLQALLPQLVRLAAPPAAPSQTGAQTDLLELLVTVRSRLRAAGQWAMADQIRDGLATLGYTLQDTPGGTVWLAER
jgi:hypothetical protein